MLAQRDLDVPGDPRLTARDGITGLERLFRGFADHTRLRILNALAGGELCVSDIVGILGLPQPLISRHLAYLRRTGLVRCTRETRSAIYRLSDPDGPVHERLLECVRSCFTGIPSLDRERGAAAERARSV